MELFPSLSPINPKWRSISQSIGSPVVYSRRKPLGESSSANKQHVKQATPVKKVVVPVKNAEPLESDLWDEFEQSCANDDEEEYASPDQVTKDAQDACWDYWEATARQPTSKFYGASLLAMYIFAVVTTVIAVLYPSAPVASNAAPLALAAPTWVRQLQRQHLEHLKELLHGSAWNF